AEAARHGVSQCPVVEVIWPPRSASEDFDVFCHAHENAGIQESDAAGDRAVKISRFLSDHLQSREAKALLERLPKLPPEEKGKALPAEAAKYGVSPCPLADVTWPTPK